MDIQKFNPDRGQHSDLDTKVELLKLDPEEARIKLVKEVEKIENKKRLNEMDELSVQILTISAYNLYTFAKGENEVIDATEAKLLVRFFEIADLLELQLEYFNWLFTKVANFSPKILPSTTNSELKELNAAKFQAVGEANFRLAQCLNQKFIEKSLALEDIKEGFGSLVHLVPEKWALSPTVNNCFMAAYQLKNSNANYDD
ncbi:MAG: hypothetical protein OHK0017_01070 [Patescibacteria group bacterium]